MSTIDYEALEAAYTYLPEPTPVRKLDRSAVLAAHSTISERERLLDARGQVRTRRVILGRGKHFSSREVKELEPLKLSAGQTRIDEVAAGRLLVCRVVALPVRTASVQLVVETSEGFVVPVSLFRIPSKFNLQDLKDIFPIGSTFAIKEPFVRSTRDGYYIRIESPSDFVRLFPDSPLLESTGTNFASKHPLFGRSAEHCKTIGNKAFQAQRWHAAKEAYTWSLSMLESSHASSTTILRATLLSNLALTNLKLSLPSSARRNCTLALSLFPPSVYASPSTPLERKLLYRLSLSLYSLDRFTECILTLSTLTSSDLPDSDAVTLLERARSRLLEQTQATFDFPSLHRQARDDHGARLDVADYFAFDAVEVKQIEGKGKGLIAKRAIQRGEVLMVCKPVASAGSIGKQGGKGPSGAEGRKTRYLTGVNLWTKSEDPWTINEVISQLAWDAAEGEEGVDTLAEELWAGEPNNGREAGGSSGRDISRLEGIVTFNGFRIEDLASISIDSDSTHNSKEEDIFSPPIAIYPPLPSACNHSCLPNASYTFLSQLFISRAREDVKEGEEITISYLAQTASLEAREGKLSRHGFVCDCELCDDERRAGKAIRKRRTSLLEEAQRIAGNDDSSIERLLRLEKEVEETYDAKTTLRPALYSVTRILSQSFASRGRYRESIVAETEGLASLGAVIKESEDGEGLRLLSPPRSRDMNATSSALWIGKMWAALGEKTKSSSWWNLARDIEKGQAGEELFELWYLSNLGTESK